ncbi:MAG: hypothetical protein ACE5R4_15315, partial [Armatimonadota bacterium]
SNGLEEEQAEKILEHGLFHKKGLWTALKPRMAHAFCRMRSERFGTEGAVVCLVIDLDQFVEGRDFEREGRSGELWHATALEVFRTPRASSACAPSARTCGGTTSR